MYSLVNNIYNLFKLFYQDNKMTRHYISAGLLLCTVWSITVNANRLRNYQTDESGQQNQNYGISGSSRLRNYQSDSPVQSDGSRIPRHRNYQSDSPTEQQSRSPVG